jgi:hypothetical protein
VNTTIISRKSSAEEFVDEILPGDEEEPSSKRVKGMAPYVIERTFLPTQIQDRHFIYHTGLSFISSEKGNDTFDRLKNAHIQRFTAISDTGTQKSAWIFDHLFSEEESDDLRKFAEAKNYPVEVFANATSARNGEKPAQSLKFEDTYEVVTFANCAEIQTIQAIFASIGKKMQATVSLQPWKACEKRRERIVCAEAVVTNRVEEISKEASDLGWHADYNPAKGLFFGITMLGKPNHELYRTPFENGAKNCPWLISAILYIAAKNFKQDEWKMGTIFKSETSTPYRVSAKHARLILFEGDALHSMEKSEIPSGETTWRVSFVWKLIIRPNQPDHSSSLKSEFTKLIDTIK